MPFGCLLVQARGKPAHAADLGSELLREGADRQTRSIIKIEDLMEQEVT